VNVLKKLTPEVRAWLYGVLTALLPLLALWGIISKEDIPLYIGVISAMVGSSVAFANRPTFDNKPTVEEAPLAVLQAELDMRTQ
jgi:hypothetical protein